MTKHSMCEFQAAIQIVVARTVLAEALSPLPCQMQSKSKPWIQSATFAKGLRGFFIRISNAVPKDPCFRGEYMNPSCILHPRGVLTCRYLFKAQFQDVEVGLHPSDSTNLKA
jgi:hypothetical protein